jgi:hypothetical protein
VIESGKGKATACEDTVLENSISERICQHCATHDCATCNSTTTYHPPLTESRLPENMTKDPLSEFLNKRTRIYARGLQGIYPQKIFLIFPTIKI